MKSQWPSQESWGTIFVPLTIVSLLCSSTPDPVTNLLSQQLSHPFLTLPCLGMGTAVVQPLSLCALKNHLPGRGHQHHQNGFFFFVATEKIPSCRVCRCSAGSYFHGAQLENAPWCNLRVQRVMEWPSTQRDPVPWGTACLQHPLHLLPCSNEAPVWIWEAESAACPILQLYLHLTQRPLVISWSHISALLSKNFM